MSSQVEKISLLGKGGFGEVWHIRDILDKKEYALKKIRFQQRDLDGTLQEVLALTKLEHQNIVRYYHCYLDEQEDDTNDDGYASSSGRNTNNLFNTQPPSVVATATESTTNNTTRSKDLETPNDSCMSQPQPHHVLKYSILAIKMELCDQSLRQWLNRQPPAGTTLATILNMFFQIAVALKFIHFRAKFIHRDLKPENILLKNRGANQIIPLVKIGDFGLVNLHGSGEPGLHTSSIGTPPYAAPEIMESIALGERTGQTMYGANVDVYSMGIIFLELLFPFETTSEFARIYEGLKEQGSFPKSFTKEHAEEQKKILEMLEPAPDLRPTSKKIHIWMKKFRRQSQQRCSCHPSPSE